MRSPGGFKSVLLTVCTVTWCMGCGGGTPTPPPVNPYAIGGNTTAGTETIAPPATPAPATSSTNPFGTPSGTPATPAVPLPEPLVAQSGTPKPKTPTAPAPQQPIKPAAPVVAEMKPEWSLAVDPAPAGSFAAPGGKLSLKMPSLGAIGPDFVESTRLRVLYPVTPGPVVALGLNDEKKQFREVWNLIDQKKLGQVRHLELNGAKGQALSPDGKYLAGKPQWDSALSIFCLAQNKPLPPIKLSGNASKLVAFAGKTRLIYEDNQELHVWSVPDFKPKTMTKLGTWKADDGWAISPGGKFFAAVTRQGKAAGLKIYDLDSGEVAATVSLAGQPVCLGVAFSVDGKQLAALLGTDKPQLRIWPVQTGTPSGQFDLAEIAEKITPRENYQGPRLEWFPDHRHLVIAGHAIYDSQEGQLVTELSSQPIYPVRVVSPDQVAVFEEGMLVTNDLTSFLKASRAPPATPPRTPESANPVPESKPADRSAVAQVALEDVDWNVKLGKPPAPVKATARAVEIPQGQIYMGRLSQSPSGIGFVMYTSNPLGVNDDGLPTAEPETRVWLEPLDLKNGDKQKSVPLPPLSLLMSVSADGALVCTQNADGLDRLDLWAARDGSPKGSLAPYHDAAPGPEQRVGYAEFIDAFTLLTSAAGRLTRWNFGTNQAIYEIEIGDLRPELSPARDYVAVSDPSRRMIYFLETKTGKSAGSVALSELAEDLASACAFHPEGRFFAVLTKRIDGGELRVIDLTDGETKKQLPLPVSGQVLQWVGSDYLLIDGSTLVSVSRECVVWNYSLPVGMHLRDSPDQRHWYIAADPARSNVYNVRGVDMPDETVVQRIGAANPRGSTILEPGHAIDIDVQVRDPEGEAEFAAKVKNLLTDRYLSARIKVVAGAPVTLTVRDNSESGWSLSMAHDGKPLWTHDIDGAEGAAALLSFEPPKHAFPVGASRGAGQSVLTVRGSQ